MFKNNFNEIHLRHYSNQKHREKKIYLTTTVTYSLDSLIVQVDDTANISVQYPDDYARSKVGSHITRFEFYSEEFIGKNCDDVWVTVRAYPGTYKWTFSGDKFTMKR